MKKKFFNHESSLTATVVMIVVIIAMFVAAYFQISRLIEQRCIGRMEEGINLAANEITEKLSRDSRMLNAAAELLSTTEDFDTDTMKDMMSAFSPLMETMKVRVLMPETQSSIRRETCLTAPAAFRLRTRLSSANTCQTA